jgi:integrase
VPIAAVLRGHLRALAIASRRSDPDALVFGDDAGTPFDYDRMIARARSAWAATAVGAFMRGASPAVPLEPIGLHAARHTAASVMIAAGVNVKALSEFLGHASITITLDRYGHLMPGNETEAVGLVDAYLERECATAARQS